MVDPCPRTISRSLLMKIVAKGKMRSKREEMTRKLRDAGSPD